MSRLSDTYTLQSRDRSGRGLISASESLKMRILSDKMDMYSTPKSKKGVSMVLILRDGKVTRKEG